MLLAAASSLGTWMRLLLQAKHQARGDATDPLLSAKHTASLQVPNWSRIGRLKRSKFPNLRGGGHTFGGGAGAGMLAALSGQQLPACGFMRPSSG